MNKHVESCKHLRKRFRGPQAAVVLGLALFPYAEARADYQLAGRTTMRVAFHSQLATPTPTAATLNAAFTQGSTAIQQDAGLQDVACPLTIRMHAASFGTTYSGSQDGADDDIDSTAELTATNTVSQALVNVVDTITFCGTSGNFGGCSSVGLRRAFVVTRASVNAATAGLIIAHEFGHTVGRNHDNNALRIMDPDQLTANHVEVTPFGCDNENDGFRRIFSGSCTTGKACSDQLVTIIEDEFVALAPSMSLNPSMSLDIDGLESSIFDEFTAFSEPMALGRNQVAGPTILEENDFSAFSATELLDGAIIDRVPAELEDYFGDEDVDELIQVMFDPTKRDQHANAAHFVGLISSGKDEHVQALVDYVGQPEANIDVAMISLGYIANRNVNDDALLFLLDQFASGPDGFAASGGLAVSGDLLARDVLLEAAHRETNPITRYTLQERASENARIELMGLREHYLNPPAVKDLPAELVPALE